MTSPLFTQAKCPAQFFDGRGREMIGLSRKITNQDHQISFPFTLIGKAIKICLSLKKKTLKQCRQLGQKHLTKEQKRHSIFRNMESQGEQRELWTLLKNDMFYLTTVQIIPDT